MKKLFFIISLTLAATISFAQTTATATRTVHKGKKETTTTGTLYAKKASKVAIITGKDALIMNGTAFTMKKGPLKAKTDATKDMQYRTFHDVLNNILLGGNTDVSKYSDTKITKSNGNTVYTITPSAGNKKLMFTSFVLTVSGKELKSIRLNRSNGQYTEYVFSDYKTGITIDDKVFK
jgi:outer membrane lipoprotein-sorting protein